MRWQKDAACLDKETDLWFALDGTAEQGEALAHCHVCPVLTDCLQYAVANNIREGVWGGQTESQRAAARRRTRRRVPAVCGTRGGFLRHYRNGEKPCRPCRDADNAARRERRRRRAGTGPVTGRDSSSDTQAPRQSPRSSLSGQDNSDSCIEDRNGGGAPAPVLGDEFQSPSGVAKDKGGCWRSAREGRQCSRPEFRAGMCEPHYVEMLEAQAGVA